MYRQSLLSIKNREMPSHIKIYRDQNGRDICCTSFIESESAPNLMGIAMRRPPQTCFEPHRHEGIELIFVIEGEMWARIEQTEWTAKPGECLVVNSFREHAAYPKGRLVYFCVVINDDFAEYLHKPLQSEQFETLIKNDMGIGEAFRILAYEYQNRAPFFQQRCRAQIWEITVRLMRGYRLSKPDQRQEISPQLATVCRVVSWLQTNFQRPVRLEDIASFVGLSPSRLSHIFKEATESTIIEYLVMIRCDYAAIQLLKTGDSVEQISKRAGFENAIYFRRMFKRIKGYSPLEFRRTADSEYVDWKVT